MENNNMNDTVCDKVIVKNGNSLSVNITKELKMLDVTAGDIVRITIEKL
ncbi:MAG: hypothetical protein IKY66_05255 [Bacteroidales bacterium]|nr:hypothetical protein [Bacteroidales bacterium]